MIKQYLENCHAACLARRIQQYTVWGEGDDTTVVRIKDNENLVTVYTLHPGTIAKIGEQDWWLVMSGATVDQLQSEYETAEEQDMPDYLQKYDVWREASDEEESDQDRHG